MSRFDAFVSQVNFGKLRKGRALLMPVTPVILAVSLVGCSFFSPDFTTQPVTGVDPEPTAEQTRSVELSVDASSRDHIGGVASEDGAAAGFQNPGGGQVTQGEGQVQAGTAAEDKTTDTNTTIGAGPLNAVLGDNVPEVSRPPKGGLANISEQLSGLTPEAVVEAQELVLKGIYDEALPSVVLVKVSRNLGANATRPQIPDIPGIPDDFFERSGGTGFVWDDEGHIITNHHVVTQADRLTVVLADRTELEAEFLGSDPDSDLAVIKVSDPDNLLVPVTLGDSDEVYMGQLAVAIGNPFGQQFSITTGIISGIGRTIRSGHSVFSIPEVLQTDAPINPGNSGGPLLDRKGHVIGVNTQIISRTGVNSGIGFAVPINIAKQVVPSLVEDGEYNYSWLGISGTSIIPDIAEAMDLPRSTRGALVIEVVPGGPAYEAGLQGSDESFTLEGLDLKIGGDIITSIDGREVQSIDDVISFLVGKTRPDQEITADVIRDGEQEKLTITLGTRPGP